MMGREKSQHTTQHILVAYGRHRELVRMTVSIQHKHHSQFNNIAHIAKYIKY